MNKQQTAVEWLVSILNKEGFAPVLTEEEIHQALKMEKEQLIEAGIDDNQRYIFNLFS
jgi:hypothetical protein